MCFGYVLQKMASLTEQQSIKFMLIPPGNAAIAEQKQCVLGRFDIQFLGAPEAATLSRNEPWNSCLDNAFPRQVTDAHFAFPLPHQFMITHNSLDMHGFLRCESTVAAA
jgi:hypothetical protein